jgi:SWI/SNF-related matrix-associated actin-dependent regulator 1 of chromatin subfamily A
VPAFYRAPAPEQANGDVPAEYQHAGAEYILGLKHGLIGDAPGVGKTLEGILVDNAIEAESTLVVCPASLRLNWQREIHRWSSRRGATTWPIQKGTDGVGLKANYVITSYSMLTNRSILDGLMSKTWDHVILDEAHAIKDPKGNRRTKVICAPDLLPSVTGRFTLLSGTILPNQPIECYNAIRLTNFDAIDGMSVESFRRHFYEAGGGFVRGPVLKTHDKKGKLLAEPYYVNELHWSDKVRNKPRRMDELQDILRGNLMVRRLKQHVLHELPEMRYHPFPIEPTGAVKKAINHPGWKQAERLYEMDPGEFQSGVPIDGAVATAARELGEAKAPIVADYIEELLASGVEKIVVGAWHHSVLEYLEERLSKHGLVYMDGKTSPKKKQAAVDSFQDDEATRIILGQMIPLGEGWTLTAAQDAVAAELYWVSGKLDQFFDRINRRGQTGAYTLGHMPVVPGTLEERMFNTIVEKDITIHAALDKVT